ncbi:bpX6 domain-containing protein [Kitasatospora sp. NPDC097643]|uniref:bpX6 domain-containing protein n=1 Tax=Kitasatospora sp. NPDC097643 TaxID=3157230 RepID=UPI003318EF23
MSPTIDAAGFVLDVPVIGRAEAVERVLGHWRSGAALFELPGGRWLLTLPEPVDTRADRSPGQPLREVGGGLTGGGAGTPIRGELLLTTASLTERHRIAELRRLDPSDWLDLTGLTRHTLRALGVPAAPEPVADDLPQPPVVDLRAAAGIPARTERVNRLLTVRAAVTGQTAGVGKAAGSRPAGTGWAARSRAARTARSGPARLLLLVAVITAVLFLAAVVPPGVPKGAVILFAVAVTLATLGAVLPGTGRRTTRTGARTGDPVWSLLGPSLIILLMSVTGIALGGLSLALVLGLLLGGRGVALALVRRGRTDRNGQARAAGPHPAGPHPARPRPARRRRDRRPRGRWSAWLTLRGPVVPFFTERHLRYLYALVRAFEQHRWEDALRDAVPLPGSADRTAVARPTWLNRRLPPRFLRAVRSVLPPAVPTTPAAGVTTGRSLLREVYRRAAEALEHEGRIAETVYVLADLLGEPAEAVALLDRHGHAEQAAELAEARGLPADQVVALCWRAGRRERAVRIARERGAFAAAVDRLAGSDPRAARELRAAWAEDLRRAGDRLGAVDAAWPEPSLRPSVAADLRDAVVLGGATRGRALVHLLALGAGPATVALTRAVLDAEGPNAAAGRSAVAGTLAALPAADPAVDRELATAAARALVRSAGQGGLSGPRDPKAERACYDRLLKRADPLAAADLMPPRGPGRRVADPLTVTAAEHPGTLRVWDAARLDSGDLLVACGHAGVRLLTPDGRTRARWDVTAYNLVLADHGGSALLVTRYGGIREVARLDLVTRAVEQLPSLRVRQLANSYDGRHLVTVDADGIAVLDVLGPRPTVVRRVLGRGQRVLGRITRTPEACVAVVHTPAGALTPVGRYTPVDLTELWRWEMPGWEPQAPRHLDPADVDGGLAQVLAEGRLLSARRSATDPGATALRLAGGWPVYERSVAGRGALSGDGLGWAFTVPGEDAVRVTVGSGAGLDAVFTALLPGMGSAPVGVRRHGGALTCWHRSGRVFAVTADGRSLLANLRVTAD